MARVGGVTVKVTELHIVRSAFFIKAEAHENVHGDLAGIRQLHNAKQPHARSDSAAYAESVFSGASVNIKLDNVIVGKYGFSHYHLDRYLVRVFFRHFLIFLRNL